MNDEDIFDNQADTYSELYGLLCFLGEDYISRLPDGYFATIKEFRNLEYVPVIDGSKTLDEQGFCKDTLAQIALLKLNFWCDTKEEQQRYWEELVKNDVRIYFEKVGGIYIIIDESGNEGSGWKYV